MWHCKTNLSATDKRKKTDKYCMSRNSESQACSPLKIDIHTLTRQNDTLLPCCKQVVKCNVCASVCVGCSSYPCLRSTSKGQIMLMILFIFTVF